MLARAFKILLLLRVAFRPRPPGTLFLGYFLWGEQQEETRHKGEINYKKE